MSAWLESVGAWVLVFCLYCLPFVLAGLVLAAVAVIVLRDACCRRHQAG
jgi:hypothetical protein